MPLNLESDIPVLVCYAMHLSREKRGKARILEPSNAQEGARQAWDKVNVQQLKLPVPDTQPYSPHPNHGEHLPLRRHLHSLE